MATIALAAIVTAALTACSSDTAKSGGTTESTGNSASPTASTAGGSSSGNSCAATDQLTVIGIGIYADAVPLLADRKGIFAKHCLTITQKTVSNPPAAVAALSGGSADVVYVPSMPLINAISKGLKLTVIAPADGYPADAASLPAERVDDTGLYVKPTSGIKRAKDLEGKKVSVPARNAQIEITIAGAVAKDGGDASKVQWVQLDFPTALTQLAAGTIDAAGLAAPFTDKAAQAGDTRLLSPGVAFFGAGSTVGMWTTTRKNYDAKKGALTRYHDAILEANKYAMANMGEFIGVVADHTKVPVADIKAANMVYHFSDQVKPEDLSGPAKQMTDMGYLPKMPDFTGVLP